MQTKNSGGEQVGATSVAAAAAGYGNKGRCGGERTNDSVRIFADEPASGGRHFRRSRMCPFFFFLLYTSVLCFSLVRLTWETQIRNEEGKLAGKGTLKCHWTAQSLFHCCAAVHSRAEAWTTCRGLVRIDVVCMCETRPAPTWEVLHGPRECQVDSSTKCVLLRLIEQLWGWWVSRKTWQTFTISVFAIGYQALLSQTPSRKKTTLCVFRGILKGLRYVCLNVDIFDILFFRRGNALLGNKYPRIQKVTIKIQTKLN